MKISISYPPIFNKRGQKAMVSQNRNVQYFQKPTYLLPVVYAQLATALKSDGHDVIWDDGNAQLKTFEDWFSDLVLAKPDLVVFESTTPVMKFYWDLVNRLKTHCPQIIVVLTGYHSMRKPEESFLNCQVDFVLLSSNIDFVVRRLVALLANGLDHSTLEGIAFRSGGPIPHIQANNARKVENLDESFIVDRDLVGWKNYAYENGNFLRTPGTYATSVIRDCTFGRCTFCRYNGNDLTYSMMDPIRSVDEYERLINDYGVREIFDDSGVWYRGREARLFAEEIIRRGLHKRGCYFGINTRFEYLDKELISLLARANFRFVLIGYEAADDETLNRLRKGYSVSEVNESLRLMTQAGLHPHLTIMVGYYWQTQKQLDDTVAAVKNLMFRGLARTLQVTICTPLDYTAYHLECIRERKLLTSDYDDHDMSKLIVDTPIPHQQYYKAIRQMYSIAFHPKYILRQVLFLLNWRRRDYEFLLFYGIRAIRRVRQHIFNLTSSAG